MLRWPTSVENDRICLFALANPSTADAEQTDPTVAKCIKYAGSWGFGWCWVVNARAWRSTDPAGVPADPLAIGVDNDRWVAEAARAAQLVVAGWGKLGGARGEPMLRLIRAAGKTPHALKLNNDGSPAHPLYLSGDLSPRPMGAR